LEILAQHRTRRRSLRDRDRPGLGASPNTAAWTVTGDHAILDCSEPVIDRNSSYLGEPDTDAINLIIRYRDSRADVDKFPATHCPGGRHCQIDSKQFRSYQTVSSTHRGRRFVR
jgi:hypothetical protein